jgi:hypothetical protein
MLHKARQQPDAVATGGGKIMLPVFDAEKGSICRDYPFSLICKYASINGIIESQVLEVALFNNGWI